MKIQVASDLHLEFASKTKFHIEPNIDALVLAGDIHTSPAGLEKFLKRIRRVNQMLPIIIVPGNHEYYNRKFEDSRREYAEMCDGIIGVYWLDNGTLVARGFTFVGSTLYTDLSDPIAALDVKDGITDFTAVSIDNGERAMTTAYWTDLYRENREYIEGVLFHNTPSRTIVVTHMVPSFSLVQNEYKTSRLVKAFAVEMTDLMERYSPALWIYGHDHRQRMDTKIFETRVVCNQMGYYFEKLDYHPMIVEV